MSEQINLKEIFTNKLRSKLFVFFVGGVLSGWASPEIYRVADQFIIEARSEIREYIRNNNITILNMDKHVEAVFTSILMPLLEKKKVEL